MGKNNINFEYLSSITDELCKKEGKSGGWENGKQNDQHWEPSAQRISNLPNKDRIFLEISKLPDLLKGVDHVIKNPFKISSMQIGILFHIVINKRCISTGDQDYLTIIIIISVQHLYIWMMQMR